MSERMSGSQAAVPTRRNAAPSRRLDGKDEPEGAPASTQPSAPPQPPRNWNIGSEHGEAVRSARSEMFKGGKSEGRPKNESLQCLEQTLYPCQMRPWPHVAVHSGACCDRTHLEGVHSVWDEQDLSQTEGHSVWSHSI